uniref:Uncharacterized protein n=1 Tax=Anguilla anguilla TaxID=7936 RepID=A0A0E9UN59_ANGAN
MVFKRGTLCESLQYLIH